MENKKCKICSSNLNTENFCKFCQEPTEIICKNCGMIAEKKMHPACMVMDLSARLGVAIPQK